MERDINNISRRDFLKDLSTALASVPFFSIPFSFENANGSTLNQELQNKFIQVMIDGGVDLLYLLQPKSTKLIATLKENRSELLKKDGLTLSQVEEFSLHPAMKNLQKIFADGGAQFHLAVGSGSDSLSHFEQKDYLARGTATVDLKDGYLSRALRELDWPQSKLAAYGLNSHMDTAMDGEYLAMAANGLFSNRGSEIIFERIQKMNTKAGILAKSQCQPVQNAHIARACREARQMQANAKDIKVVAEELRKRSRPEGELTDFRKMGMQAAAFLSSESKTPFMTVISRGWDAHSYQKALFDRNLSLLDQFLGEVYFHGLKMRPEAKHSVVVVSEFGRARAMNSAQGTEHGHGGIALVLSHPKHLPKEKLIFQDIQSLVATDLIPYQNTYFNVLGQALTRSYGLSQNQLARIFPT